VRGAVLWRSGELLEEARLVVQSALRDAIEDGVRLLRGLQVALGLRG